MTTDVMHQMGPDRVQTLIFDELAVNYGLAKPGKTRRWHRCVAMAYSGWDSARAEGARLPSREAWRAGARDACQEGITRGIVPGSGVPEVGSPEADELFGLICAKARETNSCL